MAAVRASSVRRIGITINVSFSTELVQHRHYHHSVCVNLARLPSDLPSHPYYKRELQSAKNQFSNLASESFGSRHQFGTRANVSFNPRFSSYCFRSALPFASASHVLNRRFYSSTVGGDKGSRDAGTEVSAGSGASDMNTTGDSVAGGDWAERIRDVWKRVGESASYAGEKVKATSDDLTPYAQQLLDSHPYLGKVVIPVGGTLTATLIAWFLMPVILRKFHRYAMQGPVSLLPGSMSGDPVPYEKSFWGAMEDPVRYLVTFIAFSQIGVMVAPTTITAEYLAPVWRGAVIVSFVWFLHRWKTNVFARTLSSQSLLGLDRDKVLALDKISSIGLFVIGIMAFAEACGVAVQSIVTVGGIGGVATAFAAKDILGNVFSGLSMQFSKPFSVGDTIKAGSIEGQVVEMGLTTTSLLSSEKFPVIVPNSFFSSQVIVNKSRAEYRAIISKIPLHTEDISKIPQISDDVKSMLRSNAKVFLGKDVPYCFLSRIESSYAELTLGYNLKHMRRDELYSAEQEILLLAVQIIKNHGVALGSTWQEMPSK
ncbi:mechanosensitive ion channel protein 1, mitochondrial isoform X1 [Vigna radiata var. radiata]|uniref:Mechanosensitive ion channel protein 1, mitochondrial isoform X1 n=2 Tax=Vigna radiata var. radiata TaxID=3916 RepID=A0A1S3VEF2_VIGRR|nr:mechanosensitive ion channel protein 1, mitochondrial isoform X1 [Vigna radiata var. radiata]XP_014516737.1 mechanosensitive ion channel protein 1, mitochondrial isoform X1 [Vigna radiata var. radiata]